MKLILDDFISEELKEYLLTQDGIIDVSFNTKNFLTELDIEYNEKITSYIIMKYIELFQNNKYSILFAFDKGTLGDFNTLKYTIEDMCCEYCYRGLVMDLYENEKIKSVKSNFNYKMPAYNIEFIIEYDSKYTEKELIKYIEEKNNSSKKLDERTIIINNKKYDDALKKVSFGEYNVVQDGKRRSGESPIISFKLDNIILRIETIYDKNWLEELEINDKKDITKYISDFSYEDEKGWVSLITGDCKCFINKINNNVFNIEFSCETSECDEHFKISLNEDVEIKF